MDRLQILIEAILAKTSQANLEQELKNINEKLPNLEIKADVDKVTKQFSGLISDMNKLQKTVTESTNELGQQVKVIETIDQKTKEVSSTTMAVTDNYKAQRLEMEKLANAMGSLNEKSQIRINNANSKSDLSQNNAINKAIDQQYLQDLKAQKEMEDALLATEQRRKEEQLAWDKAQNNAINKALEDNYKQIEVEKLQTIELEKQIVLFREKINLQANAVERTYGGLVNKSALSELKAEANALSAETPNVVDKMKQMPIELNKISDTAQSSSKALRLLQNDSDSLGTTILKDAGKFSLWMVVATGFMTVINSLRSAYQTISDIDKGMAGLRQTLESTYEAMGKPMDTAQLNGIANQFVEVAKEYGVGMNDLFEGAKLVSRQYKDMGEIMAFTRAGTILQVIDNLNLVDSFKALESITNQYNMVAKDKTQAELYSMSITDKLSNVVHNAAISAKDLTDGLQRSGSILNEMGTDLDHSIGLITAGVRATQLSGTQIGIALKSVAGSIKSKESVKELEKLGISIKDTEGNFRSLTAIMEDLMIKSAGTEKSLDEVDKAISGGKFQFSKVMATLSDYSTYVQTVALSINSAGASHNYLAAQMDTVVKRSELLKEQLVGLVNSAGQGGLTTVIKGLITGLTDFVKWLNSLSAINVILVGGMASIVVIGLKWASVVSMITNVTKAWAAIQAVVDGLTFNWAALITGAIGGLMVYAATTQLETNALNAQADAQKRLAEEQQKQLNTAQSNFDMSKQTLETDKKRLQFIQDMADKHQQLTDALSHTSKGTKEYQQLSEDLSATEKATTMALDGESKKRIELNGFTKQAFQAETTALNDKVNKDKTLYENSLKTAKDYTQNALDLAKSRIDALKAETEAEKVATDVQATKLHKQAEILRNTVKNNNWFNDVTGLPQIVNYDPLLAQANELDKQASEVANSTNLAGIEAQQQKVADLSAKLAGYLGELNPNIVGDIPNKEPLDTGSSSTTEKSHEFIIESLIRSYNAQAKLTEEKSKTIQKQIEEAKKQKDYNAEISKSNELLQSHATQVSQLQEANTKLKKEFATENSASGFDTSKWFDVNGESTVDFLNQYNDESAKTQTKMKQTFDELSKLQKAWISNDQAVVQLTQDQKDLSSSMLQTQTDFANSMIDTLKKAIDEKKKIVVAGIDAEIQAEEKRHKQATDNLDDESKKFEDAVNAKIRVLDDQTNAEDYNAKLTKDQKDAQDIQNQINALMLDNSPEANSKRIDLSKQLADKQTAIDDEQRKHNIDLQKRNLQDQLTNHKNDVDAQKKAEDDKYQATKDALDKQKKDQETYYTDLANDEKNFAKIREDIIKGSFSNIRGQLDEYKKYFMGINQDIAKSMGLSFQEIQNAASSLSPTVKVRSGSADENILKAQYGNSINYDTTSGKNQYIGVDRTATNSSYQNYLSGYGLAAKDAGNLYDYKSTVPEVPVRSGFPKDAQMLQALYGDKINTVSSSNIPDELVGSDRYSTMANYEKYITDKFGIKPSNPNIDLSKFHEGGIVSGGSPNRLTDLANKLFNVKPGEQVVKSLIGELQIPQQNIMNNFIPNMQNLIGSFKPLNSMAGANIVVSPIINFSGSGNLTQNDLNKITSTIDTHIVNTMKKWGFK